MTPPRRTAPEEDPRHSLGRLGEAIVERDLRTRGYSIEARNERVAGVEIDIVARRAALLALVEVKTAMAPAQAELMLAPKQRQRLHTARRHLACDKRALGRRKVRRLRIFLAALQIKERFRETGQFLLGQNCFLRYFEIDILDDEKRGSASGFGP